MSPNIVTKFKETPRYYRNPKVASAIFRHCADLNIFEILWHRKFSEMPVFPLEQGAMECRTIPIKAIQPYDAIRIPIRQQNVFWRVLSRDALWEPHRLTEG